jgi:hypothetical protein
MTAMESFHLPVGELPDRAVNWPPLALLVDPPRKADGQTGISKEFFPFPRAFHQGENPLVAAEDGDIAPLSDEILA